MSLLILTKAIHVCYMINPWFTKFVGSRWLNVSPVLFCLAPFLLLYAPWLRPSHKNAKKEKQLTAFFSESCSVSVFSFLLITISNQKKRTRVKEIYFDVMIMTDNCVNNHHQYNYKYLSFTWKSPEILANETALLSLVRRLNHELHPFCS